MALIRLIFGLSLCLGGLVTAGLTHRIIGHWFPSTTEIWSSAWYKVSRKVTKSVSGHQTSTLLTEPILDSGACQAAAYQAGVDSGADQAVVRQVGAYQGGIDNARMDQAVVRQTFLKSSPLRRKAEKKNDLARQRSVRHQAFYAHLLGMPQYPLPPSIFSGHKALFADPIVFSDTDPTWDFDPVLYAKYTGDLSVKTQEQWANLPPGVTVGSQRRAAQGKTPVIVSLTSWPPRMRYTWLAIESIMRQSVKPDRIILNLAEDEFRGRSLPKTLRMLEKRGLEIRYGPNARSGLKLMLLEKEHKDHVIVTLDDDMWYPEGTLNDLLACHQRWPGCIVGNRESHLPQSVNGHLLPFAYCIWGTDWRVRQKLHAYFRHLKPGVSALLGVAGVLYPPQSLHPDVWDVATYDRLAAKNDDLWFTVMAWRQGTPLRFVADARHWPQESAQEIEPDVQQTNGLRLGNLAGSHKGQRFGVWQGSDQDMHRLMTHYDLYRYFGLKPMVPGAVLNNRGELKGPDGQSLDAWQDGLAQ
jgi:hypothetical protein